MLHAFPKIFALGQDWIKNIFDGEVEITEKIDGSQFVFGKVNGQIETRSKGVMIYSRDQNKTFTKAIDYVHSIAHLLGEGDMFYCEYLSSPKHNALAYERVPLNNLILFGILSRGKFISKFDTLKEIGKQLQIEVVPCLFRGIVKNPDEILGIIQHTSILGGAQMEGVVVKNYNKEFLLGGQPILIMAGKFVSEAFKEVHRTSWNRESVRGHWQSFKESFKTDARWNKSIQHLRDDGLLDNSPKDIGLLLNAIKQDITDEEKKNIKNFLWKEFSDELLRESVRGFPEYYKEFLLKNSFNP